ncbi:hypothetical protein RJ640_013725 [Escallonia rubra]|uniref:GATA-type domain-containing protein n=1 Tax=Escallonia rubra TaxID=112253 RepID=A0AA88QWQ2_9ASTE|nr:hypothetical protein RJ640_013725 [Escallonia rubra]
MNRTQKKPLSEEISENQRSCSDCKTTKTPLWRIGPAGPKTLCNACGIRFRKNRKTVMGLKKEPEEMKKEKFTKEKQRKEENPSVTTNKGSRNGSVDEGDDGDLREVKVRLMALGKEVVLLKGQRSTVKRQRSGRRMGEMEEAARLLMALSGSSVFA